MMMNLSGSEPSNSKGLGWLRSVANEWSDDVSGWVLKVQVSKSDEFCIKNEKMCITNQT